MRPENRSGGRRAPLALAALIVLSPWLAPAPASACLAREPIARVLRRADADVAACSARHALPPGRYVVHLVIEASGKVSGIEVRTSPAMLSVAEASCIETAFSRLAFAPLGAPPRSSGVSTFAGRRSRVPMRSAAGATVQVIWPFTLAQ
jgi:hypothetical protein